MSKTNFYSATPLILFCHVWMGFQSATATPVNSTTSATLLNSTLSSTTLSTTLSTTAKPSQVMEQLSTLCNHDVEYPKNTPLDDVLISSIAAGLEQFKAEHPNNPIEHCVVKVPDGNELDAEIKRYNENKSNSQKQHTAFLLLARGIKMSSINDAAPCESLVPIVAGVDDSNKELPSQLPSTWQNSFLIEEPIELELGQKLIGIPLDTRTAALASGYHANIKRKLQASYGCHFSNLGSVSYTRDHLITIRQPGSVVSGITNVDGINDSRGYTKRCSYRTHYPRIYTDQMYTTLLNIELDVMSFNLPNGSRMVDISNNEFYQYENSAIDITLVGHGLFSQWIQGRTFVRLHKNHIYSCFTRERKSSNEVALNIDLRYHDAAPDPEISHVLELEENQFDTRYKSAVSLNVSPGSRSVIANNRIVTNPSAEDSAGITIAGITTEKDSAKDAPSFLFNNNQMKGFKSAIAFEGAMKLKLNSNQLLGTDYALKRVGEQRGFPVELSGDEQNLYMGLKACATLESSWIIGGLTLADGIPCPADYIPATSPTEASTSPATSSPSK
ncbi:hypothetical protein NX722_07665 [Endozoicomonas gorgoniicola]|uniref:Right handed beta helix domain-containing protein n=1 Tax=Endozoicomonas gorgoniicola TaxID=1234144 RepID=A0ABT3MT12_9GAMM|nr:hypothetical protein [Endozoicomonas gorgoniicola]MCW7552525.1 hypothetical protein [Endozoicomonas gorgoniicola]